MKRTTRFWRSGQRNLSDLERGHPARTEREARTVWLNSKIMSAWRRWRTGCLRSANNVIPKNGPIHRNYTILLG
jgi:hypothetical protein